jgi:hypothetical protein
VRFCAEVSVEAREPLGATASRLENWLLVEHSGYWPFEPLDARIFAGPVREHLAVQLAALPNSRLLLIKRPGRFRKKGLCVMYGATPERGQRFFTLEIEHHDDLAELDFASALAGARAPFGEALEHPLLTVCTHGKRDRCCARYGQPLCMAAHDRVDPAWVWQVSHVGGDRFAGNLVCLPEGLYFGRVGLGEVDAVLGGYLAGRIELEHYRGRSCYSFPVQAAEIEVRRATGLVGFDDVRLVERKRAGPDAWSVRLLAEASGDVHEVDVVVELGEETYLTCHASEPRRPRRFVARSRRIVS